VKILFATMRFGRSCYQGTERYLADLGRALRRRGHHVAYLAGDPDGTQPKAPLGAVVESDPPVLAYPTTGWATVRGLGPDDLTGTLRRFAPDMVHLANPAHIGTGLAETCRRLTIPYVITTMDHWWVCPKATLSRYTGTICDGNVTWRECVRCVARDNARATTRLAARLPSPFLGTMLAIRGMARGMSPGDVLRWFHRRDDLTRCLNEAGHVIFPSAAIESVIRPLLNHNRCSQIPHGLDERWLRDACPRNDLARTGGTCKQPGEAGSELARDSAAVPAPARPLTIGFAGALSPHKAPHLLLEAVRQLGWNDCVIRLAGGGGETAYVRRLRSLASGLNVEFVGLVPPDEMPGFLRSLDALVVPSTWPENAPYIVLEGIAIAIPVIATRIGGIPEMIVNPDRLFDVNSATSLASALRRWREAGPPTASPTPPGILTADEMAARTLRIYERLLGHG
jgi:glycosyltransferase involved in cell wall biosynthesis